MRTGGAERPVALRRVLSLPWLVFYGVGVTIGAGIFALIAEIVGIAGDHAALAFLVAGLVAGFTGFSYAVLAGAYPRAAGEAVFVKTGIGDWAGRIVGYGVVAVAITSSAVIGLAFARYVASFSGIPEPLSLVLILVLLSGVAIAGVRESVAFAALITVLEAGTLIVVIVAGTPMALSSEFLPRVFSVPTEWSAWSAIFGGAFVAFFAFIGFEDIENMAEETQDAARVIPLAIVLTLVISVAIYGLVAVVAASYPDRAALVASKAPLADLFSAVTGWPGAPVAVMASIAMVNGILVQIVMASRVIYGMSREAMVPAWLGSLHAGRQTPVRAILLIALATALLGLFVPLLRLAELTSLTMLLIFATVNLSLFLIGRRDGAPEKLRRWRYWGLFGAAVSLGLVASEIAGRH
jgi:basic amino acid/polyamine antiporter, APA family